MQYKEFKLPGLERPVFVHHEDDWTGVAIVEWWDKKPIRVEIPAKLLLALSFTATKQWVLSELAHALDTRFQQLPNADPPKRF